MVGGAEHTCSTSRRLHRQHGLGEGASCSSRGALEKTLMRRAEHDLHVAQGGVGWMGLQVPYARCGTRASG